jgi:exosortase
MTAIFVALILVTLVCWGDWLVMLLRLAVTNEQYSHVLLVLPVSLSLAILEGRAQGLKPDWSPRPALPLLWVSLIPVLISKVFLGPANEIRLAIAIASLVSFWIGVVLLLFGVSAVRHLAFPLFFLFLIVPIPQIIVEKCIRGLQIGSSEAAYILFRWAGVPVLKSGFVLSLPTLEVEIAKQCSGIRSSLVLVISSLILGHLYLRSRWGKTVLVLTTIPIGIAKNAVRIFTLSMLGIHVNSAFLYGRPHRNGGVIFFMLALAAIVCLIKLIHKAETCIVRPVTTPLSRKYVSSLKSSIF